LPKIERTGEAVMDFLSHEALVGAIATFDDFENYRAVLQKYRCVIDTGKLAEFYCVKLFGLTPYETTDGRVIGNGLWDASTADLQRVEIKHRAFKKTPPGMKLTFENFHFVLYVELDPDLIPMRIWKIDRDDITQTGPLVEERNKYVGRVSFRAALQDGRAKLIFENKSMAQL
jgi:hypothetical protein